MDGERLVERKEYQGFIKNKDGEIETVDLVSKRFENAPDVDNSLFVTNASPTIIKPLRRPRTVRKDTVTLCMGDAQIGFRDTEPFHDERAMSLGLVAIRAVNPDNIVLTGDMIDLPAFSKFAQREDWRNTTQNAIDRYHQYLAEIRANAPNSRIIAVHGNHEMRQPNFIQRNAAELLGLRRANMAAELGVLTLQYLCRYDEVGVEGVDGWPNAAYWLEDDLKVTHGTNVAKGGSNAAKYLQQEMTSTVYGHSHRSEVAYRTIPTRDGNKQILAGSPGCLARIDGAVPSFRYSVNAMNETIHRAEDWQQGVLVLIHNPRNHHASLMRIDDEGIQVYDRKLTLD